MAKNLIPEIAKMLGVELGEVFTLKGYEHDEYRISEKYGLAHRHRTFRQEWQTAEMMFRDLIYGRAEIVKLPWKPKKSDEVYTFSFTTHEYNSRFCPHKGVWYVTKWNWTGFPWQIAALDKGWVFRTKQEAEAALPAVATAIGVEYKL